MCSFPPTFYSPYCCVTILYNDPNQVSENPFDKDNSILKVMTKVNAVLLTKTDSREISQALLVVGHIVFHDKSLKSW